MKTKIKTAASFLLILCMALSFFSCGKKTPADESTAQTDSVAESVYESGALSEPEETVSTSAPATEKKSEPTEAAEPATKERESTEKETQKEESTTSKYTRTGESVFSDDPDNKYISAVASKYKLDKSLLAAVYTIPDADGNMVMEFDGTKDENGKLIRNENTLKAIYTIDKNLNSKRASKDSKLNEYSSLEAKTMFFTVTKYIIPKFQNEL